MTTSGKADARRMSVMWLLKHMPIPAMFVSPGLCNWLRTWQPISAKVSLGKQVQKRCRWGQFCFCAKNADKAHFICTEKRLHCSCSSEKNDIPHHNHSANFNRGKTEANRFGWWIFGTAIASASATATSTSSGDLWSHLLRLCFGFVFAKRHKLRFARFLTVFLFGGLLVSKTTLTSIQLRPFCVIQLVMCPLSYICLLCFGDFAILLRFKLVAKNNDDFFRKFCFTQVSAWMHFLLVFFF